MSNNFETVRDIGYSEKIWGYLPVHEGYLPVYFKEYCYPLPPPPTSKQASTIHVYFVSATPHTVIRLLLIHSSIECAFHLFILRLWFLLCYVCIPLTLCPLVLQKMEMAALFSCPIDV